MAVTILNIIPAKQAESTQTTQYTSTAKTVIDKFSVTNTSAAYVDFSCNLVKTGDSPGDDNLIIKERTIAPSETYLCPELAGQSLELNGYISTLASVATSLTISASGRLIE